MIIPFKKRLSLLREELVKQELQACIIPSSDPHQSEYTADCWKFREYLSGFTGSAGILVVGTDMAGLWTDSRYFIQAEEELKGSGIQLFMLGIPETPSPEKWIIDNGFRTVGLDGSVFSTKDVLLLSRVFGQEGIKLNTFFEPYITVWPNRPGLPEGEIYLFPEKFSGETFKSKLSRLRFEIRKSEADCMPLAALDEIAWLLNLRGCDVDYNPVGICFAFLSEDTCILFADSSKIKDKTAGYLRENGIATENYHNLRSFLKNLNGSRILLDKSKLNYQLYQSIPDTCTIVEGNSPITLMKAIKNQTELAGFRKAMVKDGVALVRFWRWMEESLEKNSISEGEILLDEWTIGEKIAEYRSKQENYICESFCPIVGYNEHGAIVHYEATRDGAFPVKAEGLLLIDTGGQYLDGTTDITRSWSLFKETPVNYKEDYTCLLKGLIALSTARFPTGTRGAQLDVLARQFLWKRNLNFGHGTGHGVGHFLNVHEGPQSIRMNENPTNLEVGMVLSNEPGLYRAGQYGIRLENLILVCEKETSCFGKFLSFETLTLLPFDLKSIEKKLLSPEEKNWINEYHQTVYEHLATFLNLTERRWLQNKTKKIK